MFLLAWLMPWRPAFRTRAKQSKLSFFVHRRDIIGRHIAKYGSHEVTADAVDIQLSGEGVRRDLHRYRRQSRLVHGSCCQTQRG